MARPRANSGEIELANMWLHAAKAILGSEKIAAEALGISLATFRRWCRNDFVVSGYYKKNFMNLRRKLRNEPVYKFLATDPDLIILDDSLPPVDKAAELIWEYLSLREGEPVSEIALVKHLRKHGLNKEFLDKGITRCLNTDTKNRLEMRGTAGTGDALYWLEK